MLLRKEWYLVSSHGNVLFYIAARPGCTIVDMAESLCLTPRTIWSLVGDLRRAGMLHVLREGHRHRYAVNLDAGFQLPTLGELPLGTLVGNLAETLRASKPNGAAGEKTPLTTGTAILSG